MNNIKAILIEDDLKKIEDIKEFFKKNIPIDSIIVRESYQSGIRELLNNHYDLLLLDMSIPTFDKTPFESGGHYEKFGGYNILQEISRKKKIIKTILITMFDDFGESDISITLKQIDESLKEEFPSLYLGSVFYNAKENKWQDDLRFIVETVFNA